MDTPKSLTKCDVWNGTMDFSGLSFDNADSLGNKQTQALTGRYFSAQQFETFQKRGACERVSEECVLMHWWRARARSVNATAAVTTM